MSMTSQTKEVVTRALENAMGDDLYRARSAFRNYTQAQMDEQYGQSGKTPRQILAEYQAHEAKIKSAQAEVARM